MRGFLNWLNSPAGGAVLMWILTQAAATMPMPGPNSSVWWTWLHGLLQVICANADRSGIKISIAPPANPPAPAAPITPVLVTGPVTGSSTIPPAPPGPPPNPPAPPPAGSGQ